MLGSILIAWWAWRRARALNRSSPGWALLCLLINGAVQGFFAGRLPALVVDHPETYIPAKIVIALAGLLITVLVVDTALPRPLVYRAGLLDRIVEWFKLLAIFLLPQAAVAIVAWWAAPAKIERWFAPGSPAVLAVSIVNIIICWFSWTMALYEATTGKGLKISGKAAANHWRLSCSRLPFIGRWFLIRSDREPDSEND